MTRTRPVSGFTADQLIDRLAQARSQLRALIGCLPDGGWLGPRAEHLNPPLWEYGHIVWFQERWCLRENPDGIFTPSMVPGADALYDSSAVPHDSRWDLPLLEPAAVDGYAGRVFDAMATRLHGMFNNELAYFAELSLYHELMHIEAWWMAFQNLGYAPPHRIGMTGNPSEEYARMAFAAGEVDLGSRADEGFIFDNEKWRHTMTVPAFDIDASPVSEAAFAEFVDAGGYRHKSAWTDAGWAWREANEVSHPLYWMKEKGSWQVRRFEQWTPIIPDAPMLHVNHHEAAACAAWMGRQLPSAAQWLRAASAPEFRRGAAWEWLREPFAPYPGFSPDPYRDYSQPWFHSHQELRGGGPFTDPMLSRPGFRNFYLPHRRDPFAGIRTVNPD
jgi:ergothioneine biosynthesis protein EgtB